MTKLLERAFEQAKILPASRQDEVGAMLLDLVEQDNSGLRFSASQEAEVRRRLVSSEELVPDGEMKALFSGLTDLIDTAHNSVRRVRTV